MNPEDFNYFQSRVSRFISGSRSGRSFLSGAPVARVTRISGIFPKRRIPQEILSKLSAASDDGIESSKSSISSLGRVTLDLEIINNNLDRIAQIILGDYKSTQETNKKEIEEYRKRVANRGRIFGKKELGDKKTDLLGGIKKFVGSFFSGTGGSIRALAMFNLLQGLMSGDPSKIIGPLLGIGMTYIPAIVGNIVSGVAGGLATKLFSGGGATQAAGAAAPMATKMPRFAKFGRNAALAGLFATMAASIIKPDEDPQRKRLEDLTAEQKASVSPDGLQPITQDDLKRFDNLNKKFEAALDFLLGKKPTTPDQQRPGRGGGGGGGAPPGVTIQDDAQALTELGITQEQFNAYKQGVADVEGARYDQMGGAGGRFAGRYQMGSGEIASAAAVMGISNPSQEEFLNNPALQEKIYMGRTVLMNRRMMQLSPEYKSMSPAERLPVLAGAQLGEGNLTDHLKGKSISDSRGVKIERWINAARSRLSQSPAQPAQSPVSPVPRDQRPAATTPAARQQPRVIMIPAETGTGDQQSSAAVGANDIVPAIDTTYPENFLALYSKLIYQIV